MSTTNEQVKKILARLNTGNSLITPINEVNLALIYNDLFDLALKDREAAETLLKNPQFVKAIPKRISQEQLIRFAETYDKVLVEELINCANLSKSVKETLLKVHQKKEELKDQLAHFQFNNINLPLPHRPVSADSKPTEETPNFDTKPHSEEASGEGETIRSNPKDPIFNRINAIKNHIEKTQFTVCDYFCWKGGRILKFGGIERRVPHHVYEIYQAIKNNNESQEHLTLEKLLEKIKKIAQTAKDMPQYGRDIKTTLFYYDIANDIQLSTENNKASEDTRSFDRTRLRYR